MVRRIIIGFLISLSMLPGFANLWQFTAGAALHTFSPSLIVRATPVWHTPSHAQPDTHSLLELLSEEKDVEDRDEKKNHGSDVTIHDFWSGQSLSATSVDLKGLSPTHLPEFLRFCNLRL